MDISFACWRYGYEERRDDNIVTVIVSVFESAEDSFHTAAQRIKGILAQNFIEEVSVLFLKNEVIRNHDQPKVGLELPVDVCNGRVLLGVSIGIRESSCHRFAN